MIVPFETALLALKSGKRVRRHYPSMNAVSAWLYNIHGRIHHDGEFYKRLMWVFDQGDIMSNEWEIEGEENV